MLVAGSACSTAPPIDADMAGGRDVYASCAGCHGADGTGGIGPALASVRETFPDCNEQIRWISLGSERWKSEVGPTYGANGAEIDNVMPSFESLDERSIRQVAMYERVRFGGGDLETERSACGL